MIRLLEGDMRARLAELEADSLDACVTDPPYEIGFMGRSWDASGVAFDPDTWRAVLRTLKPGAHLVAFGGRTIHRMAVAIEDAGFEIRDRIHWCYATGFPKNLSVSAAIDKLRHDRDQVLEVTAWIREQRDRLECTNRQIDAAFGFAGMAGHWTSQASQPAVPTLEQWSALLVFLGIEPGEVPDRIRHLAVELNTPKGEPGRDWNKREVTGSVDDLWRRWEFRAGGNSTSTQTGERRDKPATDRSARWDGWGTALKPAVEGAVLARKPLSETSIARNVLRWGTGAINIDASRFRPGDPMWPFGGSDLPSTHSRRVDSMIYGPLGEIDGGRTEGQEIGRWPANLLAVDLDQLTREELLELVKLHGPDQTWPANLLASRKPSRKEKEAGCEGLPTRTGAEAVHRTEGSAGLSNPRAGAGRTASEVRNWHPTVKPVWLMRYLVRLVTPPGGVVVDPFCGSGSTLVGAASLGLDALGIDLEGDHLRICKARVQYASHRPVEAPPSADDGVEQPPQLNLWSST